MLKLGVTTCLRDRERTFRCNDPAHLTVYTTPVAGTTEPQLLNLLKSFGFNVGRAREVFDMELTLISQIVAGKPPTGVFGGTDLLKEFLKIELTPGLTIETACYPCLAAMEFKDQPTPHVFVKHRRMLAAAGLAYYEVDPFEPGYIVIESPNLFIARFPDLKHMAPFIVFSEGVWVYSEGRGVNSPAKHRLLQAVEA